MPINGISVGKDITIQIANTAVGSITINRVKMHSPKQKNKKLETIALDGLNRHLNIPIGWEGSFEMERTSPAIDSYFANLELGYYNGQTIPLSTITETITEANGLVTQFQYQGCQLALEGAGDWKGDELITQKIDFVATARIQLA